MKINFFSEITVNNIATEEENNLVCDLIAKAETVLRHLNLHHSVGQFNLIIEATPHGFEVSILKLQVLETHKYYVGMTVNIFNSDFNLWVCTIGKPDKAMLKIMDIMDCLTYTKDEE